MDGVTYKLGLDVTALLSGAARSLSALRGLGNVGSGAFRGAAGAARGLGDVLFKLPSQIQSVTAGLSALSLPSRLAGSLETTSVAFGVLLGSSTKAKQVLGEIRDLAAATPFEFPELASAARSLAAFGESAADIPEVLRRIGDIAAGTETPIADLAAIYGKARVAGTLFAEDINQLTGRGIPVIQQFADQMGVSAGEVKKLAEQGKITFPMLETAFKNLTGQGGQFNGMMGSISATFAGKMSTLQDSFKTLLAEMGAGINEGLKPVMDELTAQLDGQQGLARQIGENIGMGIEAALNIVKDGQTIAFISAGLDLAGAKFGELMEEAGRRLYLQVTKAVRLAMQVMTGDKKGMMGDMVKPAAVQKMEDDKFINAGDKSGSAAAQARLNEISGAAVEKARDRRNRAGWREIGGGINSAPGKVAGWMNGLTEGADGATKERGRKGLWRDIGAGINSAPGKVANWMGGLTPTTSQRAAAMLQGLSGTTEAGGSGGGMGGGGEDRGRPGGARNLGKLGGLQMAFQQADKSRRGSWGDFVKGRMGSDFDKLDARGQAALLSAAPEGKTKDRYGREAERRAASDRMKSAAGAMNNVDPKDAAAIKTMALLEKHVPEIAKTLKEAMAD